MLKVSLFFFFFFFFFSFTQFFRCTAKPRVKICALENLQKVARKMASLSLSKITNPLRHSVFKNQNNEKKTNKSSRFILQYDDLAELEWLSNFVEESFSSEDLQKLQLISGMKARTDEASETSPEPNRNSPIFHPEMSVPAKARSKRSRAAPCNWNSRLLVLSQNTSDVVISAPPNSGKKTVKASPKKKDGEDGIAGEGRKCLHCATDKTPQWRTGPMGPKTLCNACGVRYKSGRLVPEYRPAASPTFMLTKHSNSHRKVMELRRQKEMVRGQHQQPFIHHQDMVFDVSNGDDYLIHQHVGPDFRQLI
jgi:hypothetical protein